MDILHFFGFNDGSIITSFLNCLFVRKKDALIYMVALGMY